MTANYSIPAILRSALATGDTLYKLATAGWGRLAIGATDTVMAVSAGLPSWQTLSTLIDAIGSTRGAVLYRGASGWAALNPVAALRLLKDGGVGADPSWVTVAAILEGLSTTRGAIPYRAAGAWSTLSLLANQVFSSDGTDLLAKNLTDVIDGSFGSTRGSILYRGLSGWVVLVPSASGKVLTDGGVGADPSWATPAASGQVKVFTNVTLADGVAQNTNVGVPGFTPSFITAFGVMLGGSHNQQTHGWMRGTDATSGVDNMGSLATDTTGAAIAVMDKCFGTDRDNWICTNMGSSVNNIVFQKSTRLDAKTATVNVIAVA